MSSISLFLFVLFLFSSLLFSSSLAPKASNPAPYNPKNKEPEEDPAYKFDPNYKDDGIDASKWLFKLIPPEQPQWTIHSNYPRPPGTLLLNMLIKNEAVHLNRTLPRWAKIIDYWIIGVDDHNTDNSEEVIKKHLGHIPGGIEIVKFDGMGPTWTTLVQAGLRRFPKATHGIVADADFAPMNEVLNKMELDLRCSKHMYTIWTEDHRNERKMDWIYRNIKGARVLRRTHQIVEVPRLPEQEVFQTLVDLPIEEREGGFQDRTPGKNLRYIGFLEADLHDYPNDTRTLYYLGYAHHDIFAKEAANPKQEHWDHLAKGVEFFKQRAALDTGNAEERWFAMLKIAEIYERYYKDWNKAQEYYTLCTQLDGERADAWFYLGQHFRLANTPHLGYDYLLTAAQLPIPDRSLFQWHYLYYCLSKLELGRIVRGMLNADTITKKQLKEARRTIKQADCSAGDAGNYAEIKTILQTINTRLEKLKSEKPVSETSNKKNKKSNKNTKNDDDDETDTDTNTDTDNSSKKKTKKENQSDKETKKSKKSSSSKASKAELITDDRSPYLHKLLSFFLKHIDDFDTQLSMDEEGINFYAELMAQIDILTSFHTELEKEIQSNTVGPNSSCKAYRIAVGPYLKLMKTHGELVKTLIANKSVMDKWAALTENVKTVCR